MKSKRCIITVAFREFYTEHQKKQEKAIRKYSQVDYIKFIDRLPTMHGVKESDFMEYFQSNAYCFKPWAIQSAIEQGYNSIIWLDPSMLPMFNIDEMFDELERTTMLIKKGTEPLAESCLDRVALWFGIRKEQMREIGLTNLAGSVYGFNLSDEKVKEVFDLWMLSANEGCFGTQDDLNQRGHKVDEVCMALSIQKIGIIPEDINKFKFISQKEL